MLGFTSISLLFMTQVLVAATASCFTAATYKRYTAFHGTSFLPQKLPSNCNSYKDAHSHRISNHRKKLTSLSFNARRGPPDAQDGDPNGNAHTTKPYLEIHHSPTNTQIILLGCLHGSTSSAKDVEHLLYYSQPQTDVVVLELCPARYKDLIKYMMIRRDNDTGANAGGGGSNFVRMVSNKIEARGISAGIAAAVLGGASGLSSALSGFEPGLEFITSIEYVQNRNNNSLNSRNKNSQNDDDQGKTNSESCDIILGDRMVDETLRRVGSLPKVSLGMWNNLRNNKWKWNETHYAEDATVLSDAVFGNRELREADLQVDMRRVLTRNREVVLDLLRLTLPSFLLLQLITLLLTFSDAYLISTVNDNSVSLGNVDMSMNMLVDLSLSMSRADWVHLATDFGMELLTSIVLIGVGYISLALPAVRVILSERDNQLVEAIEAACEVAAEKQRGLKGSKETDRRARVVAVLGLLHVNGVAKKLVKR